MNTNDKIQAALKIMLAVAEAIREAGSIPSGHLYAALCGHLSIGDYDTCIAKLVGAGLVRQAGNHMLEWVGPKK